MDEEKIIEIIEQHCEIKEDRKYLACAEAFQIAKELKINVSIIGKLCNQQRIKVKSCQLGCF
ncbi:hypothetical protein [Clostridium sp. DJ247]|uniref:hypothetical protein n=1 Tax=Clostridium sp. DJ247 TaxID=2726188 RepID=UPI0016265CD3|nr:hypothetical protein [Clostridium sp. DJ247]MBC2581437.1 hypothetical protein [Clostridium sp. DJ247]